MTKINYTRCLESGINFWNFHNRLHYNCKFVYAKTLDVLWSAKKSILMFGFPTPYFDQTNKEIELVNYFLNMKENERPQIPMC